MDNPLDRFGLSPFASVEEITAAMRERAEEAPEEERAALREAWEELTLHPRARLRAAIFTSPPSADGASPGGGRRPPPLSPELGRPPAPAPAGAGLTGIALIDLIPRPLVAPALEASAVKRDAPRALPRLSEDPLVLLASQPRIAAGGPIEQDRGAPPSRGARKT